MTVLATQNERGTLFHQIRGEAPQEQEKLLVTHTIQAKYRLMVLDVSSNGRTTTQPVPTSMALMEMELLNQELGKFQLDVSQDIESQFGDIARIAALLCAEYNTSDLRLLDTHQGVLAQNAEYIYQQVLDISRETQSDSTNVQAQERLNLLRGTTIRNDILVYLMNYAEYLSRRCDYRESMEWYQKCVTVTRILGSAQFYLDAQLNIHATFPDDMEPSGGNILELKQLIEDCNTFVYHDDGSGDGVHMTEAQRRNRTNRNHYELLEFYTYFKTCDSASSVSPMFFDQLERFEGLRGEFVASFAPGVTPVFELCSLSIVHKIEHAISGHVWKMHQSKLDIPDSAQKYIDANFWLPPNTHVSDPSCNHDGVAKISKSILYQDCFHLNWVDMRFPAIQAFTNAERCSSGKISKKHIEDQLYYIALKMLGCYSADVATGIITFLERNMSDTHIQHFIETVCLMRQSQSVMLAQTSGISEGTIVSGYLKEILLRGGRYFREMLDEVHPQGWCLAYSIGNETFSIDHSTGLSPIAIEDILYRYSGSSGILHSSLLRVMGNGPTQKNSINLLADPRMLQLFIDFYAPQIRSKSEAHTRGLQRKVEAQTAILSRTVRELSSALLVLESHRLSSGLNPQDQEGVLRALCDGNESAIRQLRGLMMRLMGK